MINGNVLIKQVPPEFILKTSSHLKKECGHIGGKVLIQTSEFIRKLTVARLPEDLIGLPTLLMTHTDANSVKL